MKKYYIYFNDYRETGYAKKRFIDMIYADSMEDAISVAEDLAREEYEENPVESYDSIVNDFMENANYNNYDEIDDADKLYIDEIWEDIIFSYIEPIVEEIVDDE